MFNNPQNVCPEQTASPPRSPYESLMHLRSSFGDLWCEMEDELHGKKRNKKRKKTAKKRAKTKRSDRLEKELLLQSFNNGILHSRNEMLTTMLELTLAASKGTLRDEVLEVGFEILEQNHGTR